VSDTDLVRFADVIDPLLSEVAAEIRRLRAVEKAARRAVDHSSGGTQAERLYELEVFLRGEKGVEK